MKFLDCERPERKGLCSIDPLTIGMIAAPIAGKLMGGLLGGGGGGGGGVSVKNSNETVVNVATTIGAMAERSTSVSRPTNGYANTAFSQPISWVSPQAQPVGFMDDLGQGAKEGTKYGTIILAVAVGLAVVLLVKRKGN
jgi:hypothetical protein